MHLFGQLVYTGMKYMHGIKTKTEGWLASYISLSIYVTQMMIAKMIKSLNFYSLGFSVKCFGLEFF